MATKHERKRWKTKRGRRQIAAEREARESPPSRYELDAYARAIKKDRADNPADYGLRIRTLDYAQ